MTKKKDTSPELTQKQKKFVEEFQKNWWNMTQAALVAYNTTSYNTAANIWFDNMRKPKITQYF